ncbi:MAG: hypothetical protein U0521_04365 [Anaerolineae bacterium]
MGGVILNRFDVTWFAMAPVSGETYSPHWMEVAILVGVAAGLVLVYSLIARYFPVYDEVTGHEADARQPRRLTQEPAVGD